MRGGRLLIGLARQSFVEHLEISLDGRAIKPALAADGGFRLPRDWRRHRNLEVAVLGMPLLGTPIDISMRTHVTGFVEVNPIGQIEGWAWLRGDPEADPVLSIHADVIKPFKLRAHDMTATADQDQDGTSARRFVIPRERLPDRGLVSVRGPDGRDLLGSPLMFQLEAAATREAATDLSAFGRTRGSVSRREIAPDHWRPLPVDHAVKSVISSPTRNIPPRPGIDIIIPLFRGAADFIACIASLGSPAPEVRILLVDDFSPDFVLTSEANRLHAAGKAILLRHRRNLGFPSAVNTGLQLSVQADAPRDVVLLNADTIVPEGWLERMAHAAYAAANVGCVTPMTNDGTIVSYPRTDRRTCAALTGITH